MKLAKRLTQPKATPTRGCRSHGLRDGRYEAAELAADQADAHVGAADTADADDGDGEAADRSGSRGR